VSGELIRSGVRYFKVEFAWRNKKSGSLYPGRNQRDYLLALKNTSSHQDVTVTMMMMTEVSSALCHHLILFFLIYLFSTSKLHIWLQSKLEYLLLNSVSL
jgi:hypothetical protein